MLPKRMPHVQQQRYRFRVGLPQQFLDLRPLQGELLAVIVVGQSQPGLAAVLAQAADGIELRAEGLGVEAAAGGEILAGAAQGKAFGPQGGRPVDAPLNCSSENAARCAGRN